MEGNASIKIRGNEYDTEVGSYNRNGKNYFQLEYFRESLFLEFLIFYPTRIKSHVYFTYVFLCMSFYVMFLL